MTLLLQNIAGTPITLDLEDVANVALSAEGWTPAIARLRTGWMGNRSPYEDVDEDLVMNAFGGTGMSAATLLSNLSLVQQFLDRVHLWWDDPNTYVATTIELQVVNASSQVLSALLVPREDQGLYPKENYADHAPMGWMEGGVLRFRRRGQWLGPLVSQVASGTRNSGEKHTAIFPSSLAGLNPLWLSWEHSGTVGAGAANVAKIGEGICIYSHSDNRLGVYNANVLTATNFTSVVDTTNKARGTNVLRYTPPNITTAYLTGTVALALTGMKRIALYATMRANATGQTFQVRPFSEWRGRRVYGQYTTIEFTDMNPHVAHLGTITQEIDHGSIGLEVRAFTSGGATLDIDEIVVCGADNRTEGAVTYAALDNLNAVIPAQTYSLSIHHQLLTARDPAVQLVTSAPITRLSLDYQGNACLSTTGDRVSTVWLTTTDNYWRATSINGTLLTTQLTANRNRAHVLPV